jgi:hypothetical protein
VFVRLWVSSPTPKEKKRREREREGGRREGGKKEGRKKKGRERKKEKKKEPRNLKVVSFPGTLQLSVKTGVCLKRGALVNLLHLNALAQPLPP